VFSAEEPVVAPDRGRFRLAVVLEYPHPYFCRFYQHLAAHPQVEVAMYFYLDRDSGFMGRVQWETDVLSGYQSRVLNNYSPIARVDRFWGLFHPGLLMELNRRYDAVLVRGWHTFSSWLTALTALVRGIPILLHSDQNVIERPAGLKRPFRNHALRWLFRRVSAFLVVGQRNADFYRSLGVSDDRMFFVPFAVDNEFYAEQARRLKSQRAALRRQQGIPPDATVILFLGRFVADKRPLDLLAAFRSLDRDNVHLVLGGDGPLRSQLHEYVRSEGIGSVHFPGFRNYRQVPEYYASADIFVLPSGYEPQAGVINEAMNFGLPIVATDVVGAAPDRFVDGQNGFLYRPGDVRRLTEHLRVLIDNPGLRSQMGEESVRRIAEWNFDRGVEGVLAALHAVTARNRGPARPPGSKSWEL
jgi:glycosyltransferase involved in cell wall biosynthesis